MGKEQIMTQKLQNAVAEWRAARLARIMREERLARRRAAATRLAWQARGGRLGPVKLPIRGASVPLAWPRPTPFPIRIMGA
jgi:hypothetical protein